MVTFPMSGTSGSCSVMVNETLFGYIDKGNGFFTDSSCIKEFTVVSPADLRRIAEKVEEIRKTAM